MGLYIYSKPRSGARKIVLWHSGYGWFDWMRNRVQDVILPKITQTPAGVRAHKVLGEFMTHPDDSGSWGWRACGRIHRLLTTMATVAEVQVAVTRDARMPPLVAERHRACYVQFIRGLQRTYRHRSRAKFC